MNIVVYCSSREGLGDDYEKMAQAVGNWIGSHHHTLVYGGVNAGLMHTVAQATADAGGNVIGIVPEMFAHRADAVCTEVIACHNLSDRKDLMIEKGDAYICLPGGIGTIDEWISTLSHFKVVREQHRHIVVVNIDGAFDAQLSQLAITADSVFTASSDYMNRMSVVTDIDQLEKVLTERIHSYEKE